MTQEMISIGASDLSRLLREIDTLRENLKGTQELSSRQVMRIRELESAASPTTLHDQVLEFMRAVGQVVADKPAAPDASTARLRARLVLEEAFEFAMAIFPCANSYLRACLHDISSTLDAEVVDVDMIDAADALADIDYVVEGSRISFGIDGAPIAREVHRANMTKLGGPMVNGKQEKPEGWRPPDIASCLWAQGWPK